ncbi:MAG: septum formation initiator family protein [Oscillospiraceae bacterium]|jgi:cell division protein FtsB|nr:septum formation initiator family protein [Oscillospiraceae bacterium]
MKLPRSGLIAKIVVFALIIYAGVSLINLQGKIETAMEDRSKVRRQVAEKELSNAELEYEIEHYNEPGVISDIARTGLGLVLPGEIIFYDNDSGQIPAD